MRFFIFNISVLAALGYLFTASPDQSFSSWITGTSKTVVAQIDDVMMDGKETIESTPVSLPDPDNKEIIALRHEMNMLKSDIAALNTYINSQSQSVVDDVNPAQSDKINDAGVDMPHHMAAPVPPVALNTASETEGQNVQINETVDEVVSDADIAEAFQAIAAADQNNVVAPNLQPDASAIDLQYMSPNERIDDLGKLMIDMQVFYLEHSGV